MITAVSECLTAGMCLSSHSSVRRGTAIVPLPGRPCRLNGLTMGDILDVATSGSSGHLPSLCLVAPAPQMTAQPQLRTLALHGMQLSAPSLILRLMRDSRHRDLSIRPLTSKYTISQTIMFSYPGSHCLKPHTRIHHTTAIIKKQLDKTMAEKSIRGH